MRLYGVRHLKRVQLPLDKAAVRRLARPQRLMLLECTRATTATLMLTDPMERFGLRPPRRMCRK